MPNQQNDNRNQNLNPNNSDNLRDLRNTDQNRSGSQKGQHYGSSSTLDSLLSPSTLGLGTDGTGQNYSGGTGSQATNLRDLRNTDQNRSGSQKGQHHGSSSTLNSLLSPSTLGLGTDGTGQNYSGGTGSQATDQNRSGRMSVQTGSEDAVGRMQGHEVKGNSARQTGNNVSGKSGSVDQQDLDSLNGSENSHNR